MTDNYKKYLVSRGTKDVVLKLEDDEGNIDEIKVTIKQMPWSVKNRIVSSSASYDAETGNTSFDGDRYLKEALKYMIVDAPWGNTNDVFLATVGDKLGKALESLVPVAFGDSAESGLSETKKDTKTTSEQTEEVKNQ